MKPTNPLDSAARLISFVARVAQANTTRLPSPLKLTWALTYQCQYRCKTCNIWQKRPEDELTTAEMLEFIRLNRSFSWVDLTGGEIFLRKDIDDVLAAIALTWKKLALLHFPTNGYLTDRIVRSVKHLLPRLGAHLVVTVSLDGDEALNDEIRGVKGGYRRQMETFVQLRRIRGLRTVLGMTLSATNLDRIEDTFASCRRYCPDLRVEDFHLNLMQLSGHYYANEDGSDQLPAKEQARRELASHRKRRRMSLEPTAWVEGRFLRYLDRFLETGVTPLPCHALRSTCFLDPWGVVFPCISYSKPLGSLRDTAMRLEPIWRRAETIALQREIWRGRCPQCWTACEAYPTLLGNLTRRPRRLGRDGQRPRSFTLPIVD